MVDHASVSVGKTENTTFSTVAFLTFASFCQEERENKDPAVGKYTDFLDES